MSDVDNVVYEGIEVILDKKRHLKYTFKSIRIITKKYGSLQKAIECLQIKGEEIDDEALEVISTLTYAGLIHEDGDLTLDKVENMMDFRHLADLPDKIVKALSLSLPASDDKPYPKTEKKGGR